VAPGSESFSLDEALRPSARLDKDEIRAALPLGFACLELGIGLDSSGRASCPWHEDKHPSFGLYTDGREVEKFACPVCAVSGDVFDLICRQESIGFAAAVDRASEMLDTLGEGGNRAPTVPARQEFDRPAAERFVLEALARAAANDGWLCVALGLLREADPVTYRQEVDAWLRGSWKVGVGPEGEAVFPHYDSLGELRGVKLRGLDGTKWCRPGSTFTSLYGAWRVRKSRTVLVCEGETDALWADLQLEAVDVYALPAGAGRFSEDWTRVEADTVFLAFDGDDAGDKATRMWSLALGSKDVRILAVPRGEDLRSWAPNLRDALAASTRYCDG
jgi:hypothetical protein